MVSNDRIKGCFLGLAMGDALARHIDPSRPGEVSIGDGTTSCMSQLMACVAMALDSSKPSTLVSSEKMEDLDIERYMRSLASNLGKWGRFQEDQAYNRRPEPVTLSAAMAINSGAEWRQAALPGSCEPVVAVRAVPLGVYFRDNIPKIVRFGITSCQATHLDDEATCASVGAALLTALALKDVPVGVWAHEVILVVKGINRVFEDSIKDAMDSVASGNNLLARKVDNAPDAVGAALFCCLVCPENPTKALMLSLRTNGDAPAVASLVGALIGARLGASKLPAEWAMKVEEGAELAALAERLVLPRVIAPRPMTPEQKA